MYPILFEGNTTSFDSYGLGVLSDCVSCVVSEERNGAYELEMTYPVDGLHFSQITHSRIIYAKPSDGGNNQAFRIYKITKPRNGIVTVNAEHISYQLNFIPTGGAEATTCQNALNGLKNNAYESCPFTFYSDNTKAGTYKQSAPASIRSRLGGTQGSILDVFGGEYEWDNFTVKNLADRGSDNGVTLRYGKNITDIKQEENIENTVTGVCPYWANEETLVTLPEKVLHSSTASLYPFQRTMILDCSSNFESEPSVADLRQFATNYMAQNNIGYPKVSISVSFVALWQTEEYKDVAPLERVGLCDYVHIYYEKLGIEGVAKVIKTEYDALLERYNKIDLGDAKSTLGDTIRGEIQDETRDKVTSQAMMNAVERATALITGNQGGYVRFIYDEDGLPQEILVMNTDSIDTATKVWRWNQQGLGYSNHGYQGPYGLAMTSNGEIVADFITSGTLDAVDIQAVNNVTGYFTKINTSTGALTWNMAHSSMDAQGNINLANGSAKIYNSTIELNGYTFTGWGNAGLMCSGYLGAYHLAVHRMNQNSGEYYEPIVSTNKSIDNIYSPGDGKFHGSYWSGGTEYDFAWAVTGSDKRLKKNIEETDIKGLETIEKMRHVQFDWDNPFFGDGHVGIGYVADELQEIEESLVAVPEKENGYLQLNVEQILAVATKAIQELNAEVKELKEALNDRAES